MGWYFGIGLPLAVVAVGAAFGAATAQPVCVECKGPAATYSCEIKQASRVKGGTKKSRALEFLCITQLAESGRHTSCRAQKAYSGPCIGQPVVLDLAHGRAAMPPTDQRSAQTGAADAETANSTDPNSAPRPTQPQQPGPPDTLQELARDTVAQSKKQIDVANKNLKNAGAAVGEALKKGWVCLVSMFSEC